MGKPRMIILIRHAQSEGNKNRDIHQSIPDHRVTLTPEGWTQAREAGRRLRSLLKADDTLHFFTSPYRRTRETTEGILSTLTSDEPEPSPFPRQTIKVYEEPRLREQDFGNFQPCSAEMERMWQERADYGHFFYRIPNGESAADAYDRISGFNESLWRQFGEEDFASVCVLVTHGLMSRVFLMKWYHFSVEYFEDLRNVNHCEFLIMRKKQDSGKYILENNLRTWSQLKREREAERKEKEREKAMVPEKAPEKALEGTQSLIPKRKQWGGCPNGCEHGKYYKKKENPMHAMQLNGKETHLGDSLASRRPAVVRRRQSSSEDEDEDDPRGRMGPPKVDAQKSLHDVVSSPDGTPSYISVDNRARSPNHNRIPLLRAGRDFGGSASGNTSRAGSDTEVSEADPRKEEGEEQEEEQQEQEVIVNGNETKTRTPTLRKTIGSYNESLNGGREREKSEESGTRMRTRPTTRRGAKANALGDQGDMEDTSSDAGSQSHEESHEESHEDDDGQLEKAETADKSIEGSVY